MGFNSVSMGYTYRELKGSLDSGASYNSKITRLKHTSHSIACFKGAATLPPTQLIKMSIFENLLPTITFWWSVRESLEEFNSKTNKDQGNS